MHSIQPVSGQRRLSSVVRLMLAAILVLTSIPAQESDEPAAYFSLSSDRTFAPGERVSIQLSANRVRSLEFRVYRVADPVAFFSTLDDPHAVGGRVRRPPARVRTPLERFHQFKRRLRAQMQNFVRAQFSADSRAEIRAALAERAARQVVSVTRRASYASVPLLNPQRLVTTWEQPVNSPNRWERQLVPVGVREKGLYLVEATDGKLRAYTIVLVTDVAVLSKAAPGRVFAEVVNRRTGEPVAGAAVVLLAGRKEIARVETSAEGSIDMRVREARADNVLVLASHGSDFAADALWGHNVFEDSLAGLVGYIYTDRPIYRPGHSVSFRGILRTQGASGYAIPGLRQVDVQIQDPDGSAVYQKKLPVSSMGTFSGELALAGNAPLGYYGIQVGPGEDGASGGFQVEEYKKPEYEVKVTPEKRRVLQGEQITAMIEARYYFGEPVANAAVAYTVHRSRYWPPYFGEEPDDAGEAEPGEYGGYGSEEVHQGTGKLDAEGRLKIEIPTEVVKGDQRYRIEARVTDASNREIAGAGWTLATVGSYLLNVQPAQYLYSAGDTASIEVEARDYDGNPVDAAFALELSEYRWDRGAGATVFTSDARTGAGGRTTIHARIDTPGSYVARAVARTPEGRDVEDTTHLWITGEGGWYTGMRERLQLVADKKSYRAGETANVLIVTGVRDARVVVSVEGRDLHSVNVVRATQPSITVPVPIRSDYAPDVYVTAAFIRDNHLYQGTRRLKVPPVEQQLEVDLTPSKPQYKPGEAAVFTIAARDHTGAPAAAEFSLGVVDEAIYAIRRDTAADILKFFYGFGYNRVATGSSLRYYFWGEAGRRAMQLAQVRERNLAQLKPERLVDPAIRKAFPDTAFWTPDLKTDAQGRAQARFSFPDSLTTWRATARGVTSDTRVGSAVQRVIVRKNLMLRLSTPRFLTQGDEVTVSALVHNYLPGAKTVRVSLNVEGADVIEGSTRDVSVASKAAAKVDWRLRASAVSKVTLLGKALTDEESDAMEISLPVRPFGVRMSEARAGSIAQPAGEAAAQIEFPGDATPGSRSLEVTLAPSLGGALFSALDYLTSFPYGCVEQTMSSFLPNVIVAQAARDLGLKGVNEADLKTKIQAGLDRLYDFQHDDGGWGWWKTDDTHPFMTAYVVAGFAQARAAGVNVNPSAISRGTEWLRTNLSRTKGDLHAYTAYALALTGDKSAADEAYRSRSEYTTYGLAFLGLALKQAGDGRANQVADELIRNAREQGTEASWPTERDTLMDFPNDTTPETTAYAVKLIASVNPGSPVLPKAITYLINHRRDGYYWASTKQTAMVIYGLTDYLKVSGELKPDFAASVRVNGREVLSRRFGPADAFALKPASIRIPEAELPAGASSITVTKQGAGNLYWSARAEFSRPASTPIAEDRLRLQREYFRLEPERDGSRIVYALRPQEGPVQPGDVIAVKLTLNAPDYSYLIVEDPIPAGAEFIERDDLYEIKSRPPWWRWWFTRREFHDDRAALFQTWGSGHSIEYFYLLKIVNPGVFRVSPARAGPMYQPDRFATTEPRTVEVRQ